MGRTKNTLDKLRLKISLSESGCWLWNGYVNEDGYGLCRFEGKTQSAHRVFYKELAGEIPAQSQLDHLCRVRNCVNPAHLEVVSGARNTRRGNVAKLTVSAVNKIREMYESGSSQSDIATMFGVIPSTIGFVVRGDSWADGGERRTFLERRGSNTRKLSDDQVSSLLSAFATGEFTCRKLAAEFGIDESQVSRIVRGKSRKSVVLKGTDNGDSSDVPASGVGTSDNEQKKLAW